MLNLGKELQKDITDVVTQIRKTERMLVRNEKLDSEQLSQISYACTEIALLSFAASDELDRGNVVGDRLLQGEISSTLWRIAIHCVNIQEWSEEAGIRSEVRVLGRCCGSLVKLLGIPEPVFEEQLMRRAPEELLDQSGRELRMQQYRRGDEDELVPAMPVAEDAAGAESGEAERDDLVLTEQPSPENEVEKLRLEIKALREMLASAVLRRDNLLLVEKPELEARYMKELGSLEAEVYRLEGEAR